MMSPSKIVLIALVGSVLLSAAFAQEAVEETVKDAANKATDALNGATDAVQNTASDAVDGAKKTTSRLGGRFQGAANGVYGIGKGIYDTIKSTGSSILSHIPIVGPAVTGAKKPASEEAAEPKKADGEQAAPAEAEAEEEKKSEEAETDAPAAAAAAEESDNSSEKQADDSTEEKSEDKAEEKSEEKTEDKAEEKAEEKESKQ